MKKFMVWVCSTLFGTSKDTAFLLFARKLVLDVASNQSLSLLTDSVVVQVAIPLPNTYLQTPISLTTIEVLFMTQLTSVSQILVVNHILKCFTGTLTALVVSCYILQLLWTSLPKSPRSLVWWNHYLLGSSKVPLLVLCSKVKVQLGRSLLKTNTTGWKNSVFQWQVFGCKTGLVNTIILKEPDLFGIGNWTSNIILIGMVWLIDGLLMVSDLLLMLIHSSLTWTLPNTKILKSDTTTSLKVLIKVTLLRISMAVLTCLTVLVFNSPWLILLILKPDNGWKI